MNKKRFLTFAEYTSLILSALGTILATNSSQVGFAVIPLTLALSLNLINRKQHSKQNSQIDKNDFVLLQERIDNLDNLLQQQIQSVEDNLKTTVSSQDIEQVRQQEITVVQQSIELIQDNLERLNNHNQAKDIVLEERINNLNNWLQQQIQNLEDNLKITVSSQDIEQVHQQEITVVQQRIELIQNNLERLNNHNQTKAIILEERIDNLADLLQQQIQSVKNDLKTKASSKDIEQICQQEITVVQQSIKLIQDNVEKLSNYNQTKEKLDALENQGIIPHKTYQAQAQMFINSLVEKEELEKRLSELSQYQTNQLNGYLEQVTNYLKDIEYQFTFFEVNYNQLADKENQNNILNNSAINREKKFHLNNTIVSTIDSDKLQSQQKVTNYNSSPSSKLPNKYCQESFAIRNKSQANKESVESVYKNHREKNFLNQPHY